MIRIAICDDRKEDREKLKRQIEAYGHAVTFEEFASGEEICGTAPNSFDLIVLDIYMDGMDGLEAAKKLRFRGIDTPIIFLTSSPDFAVGSYEVRAYDYLLKPVSEERLGVVMRRFFEEHRAKERYYVFRDSTMVQKIAYEAIEYIESVSPYLIFHMRDGKTIQCYGKLNEVEAELDDERFFRCHQSFLVNLDLVDTLGNTFRMKSGATVAYKLRDKRRVREQYFEYILKEQ